MNGDHDSNEPDNMSEDSNNPKHLTNGTSCQNSPKPESHDNEESIDESNEDTNEIDAENHKSPVDSENSEESLTQKVTNGDETSDMLKEKTDSTPEHDSKETSNNSQNLDNEELIDNASSDSQETRNENTESEHVSMDCDAANGLEFNHISETESFQFLDEAEDPISGGEPKEEQNAFEKLYNNDAGTGTFKIVTINRYHSDGENSSDCSDSEEEPQADTVSITSDADSRDNHHLDKSNEIIILENETDNRNGTQSPEIHEIDSGNSDNDDCVVTGVEKIKTPKKTKATKASTPIRRSSRSVKRKNYEDEIEDLNDDESDLEEVYIDDPLQNKSLNSKKSLLSLSTKVKRKLAQNKDDVIMISPPKKVARNVEKSNSDSHQNIYQKIAARGISVTPVSVKSTENKAAPAPVQTVPPVVQPPPEPILPTLTDDMFVVEAPSFIVPYVFEKPAVVPFKDFVENLGKEIEEEKAKQAQELLEKKKAEKAKREQERQEKRERGEEVQESEEEDSEEVKKKKAEKAERKERRRRKKEDDDVSWDGSSSEESDDESLSDDDSQTKENIIGDIKEGPVTTPKTDSYFDLTLGKFFMDIGSNLVQQYVQTDLLHQQKRKLRREQRTGHSTKSRELSIALLMNNIQLSEKTNASFTFEQKKCKFCPFKTESELILRHHLETPHMKNNVYICTFCSLELQSPHNIMYHMEMNHGVKGRLERPLAPHQCVNCPFEDHGKGKLARHAIACAKRFKPDINLAPPVDWEHPAKIPKLTRARGPLYQQGGQFMRLPSDTSNVGNMRIHVGNAVITPTAFRPRAPAAPAPVRPAGILIRQAPQPSLTVGNVKKNPSILISPSPRQASPIQSLNANAKGVVMCEICDGYIKDLEQLRNHMQWIHKVKIHPKMIYNRPPLNCQKCQFRFFTDQGLERHLLGSHGLVTSAIQEAANKGKDAGRCPVCGRAYQRKLLAHVSRDHSLVLKPAHLSYKCTVCTATFGMYRQFENHVYSAHSVVAKKAIDKKAGAKEANDAAKQPTEAPIAPQPTKVAAAKGK